MSLTSFIIVSFYLLFFAVCPSLQRSFLLVVVLIPFCCYGTAFFLVFIVAVSSQLPIIPPGLRFYCVRKFLLFHFLYFSYKSHRQELLLGRSYFVFS